MKSRRVERINSLLREVLTEVIQRDVKNPNLPPFVSISHVEVTNDLQQAKVFITLLGDEGEKAIAALQSAAGFIAARASKKVTLRYFPTLLFRLDDALDKQLKIHDILSEIEAKRPPKLDEPADE